MLPQIKFLTLISLVSLALSPFLMPGDRGNLSISPSIAESRYHILAQSDAEVNKILPAALAIAENIKDQESQGLALAYVGAKYLQLGDINNANKIFIKAFLIAENLGVKSGYGQGNQGHAIRAKILEVFAHNYSKFRNYDGALIVLKTIKDRDFKDAAFFSIATEANRLKQHDWALKFGNLIAGSSLKLTVLGPVAIDFLQRNQDVNANAALIDILAIKDKLNNDNEGILILRSVVTEYCKLQGFDQALKISRSLKSSYDQAELLGAITSEYLAIGDYSKVNTILTESIQIAQGLSNPTEQANILLPVIDIYLEMEQLDLALSTTKMLNNQIFRTHHLGIIASSYARLGKDDKTQQILQEIQGIITNLPNQEMATELLSESVNKVAMSYIMVGRYEAAENLGNMLTGDLSQAKFLGLVANSYAQAGLYDKSFSIINKIPPVNVKGNDGNIKDILLSDLSRDAAQTKRIDIALNFADKISNFSKKSWALLAVVDVYLDGNKIDEAINLAETMEDISYYGQALGKIVLTLGKNGEIDRAFALIKTITDIELQQSLLDDLGDFYIQNKQFNLAQNVAQNLSQDRQEQILGKIAMALGENGQPDQALQIAENLHNDKIGKVKALGSIVQSYLQLGQKDQALKLINELMNIIPNIDDFSDINWLLSNLVKPSIALGQDQQVKQIFERIFREIDHLKNDAEKVKALEEILYRFDGKI